MQPLSHDEQLADRAGLSDILTTDPTVTTSDSDHPSCDSDHPLSDSDQDPTEGNELVNDKHLTRTRALSTGDLLPPIKRVRVSLDIRIGICGLGQYSK